MITANITTKTNIMLRSYIHASPRWFHYGLNLTDDPGNANPIRMHNGVITDFDVSINNNVGKRPFGDTV